MFSVANGLSEMGKTVAQTAQAWTLEAQKAEEQRKAIELAEQLASQREDKRMAFQSGEAEKDRGWKTGEGDKERGSREKIASENNKTSLATAGISAGATITAAQIGAASRASETDKTLAAAAARHKETIDATIAGHAVPKINEDGTVSIINPARGTAQKLTDDEGNPVKLRDSERAKAQSDSIKALHDTLNSQTRLYEIEMRQAQAELKSILEGEGRIDPNSKAVKEARQRINEIKDKYEPQIQQQQAQMRSLITGLLEQAKLPQASSGGDKRPPLSDLIKTPGQPKPAPEAERPSILKNWQNY